MGKNPSPEVTVVCVTYNPGAELQAFAASLPAATARSVQLIFVDNGQDGTQVDEVAKQYGARVVRSGHNLGYGRGANLGLREVTSPWVLVANPDLTWQPGCIDAMIAGFVGLGSAAAEAVAVAVAGSGDVADGNAGGSAGGQATSNAGNEAGNGIGKGYAKVAGRGRLRRARGFEINPGASRGVGIVGPAIVDADFQPYPTGRAFPGLRMGIGHALLRGIWPGNPWTKAYHAGGYPPERSGLPATENRPGTGVSPKPPLGEKLNATPSGKCAELPRLVDWVSGACMLMPLQVWKQLGGFDAGYFMFFEDVDLCWRARKRGYLCALVPSAQVVHLQGKSWKDQPKAMIIAHHRSAGRFMAKKYPHLWQAPLRLALRLALRARAWIVTRRRR